MSLFGSNSQLDGYMRITRKTHDSKNINVYIPYTAVSRVSV